MLFGQHRASVWAYLARRAPAVAVEDLLAETFLVVWRSLDRVPADPLPWLYAVARRVLANDRRARGRRSALAARLWAQRGSAGDEPPLVGGVSEPVRGALLSLSEAEREAVLLIAWEELTPSEAAMALGCSAAAFRVRLHRARRALSRSLATTDAPTGGTQPHLTTEASEP